MTLAQIKGGTTSIAMFSTGSPEDVRHLARCVADIAQHQLDFAQVVHDAVARDNPKLGLAITDWIETQERKTT